MRKGEIDSRIYELLASNPCTCDGSDIFCRPCSARLIVSLKRVNDNLDRMMKRLGIKIKQSKEN